MSGFTNTNTNTNTNNTTPLLESATLSFHLTPVTSKIEATTNANEIAETVDRSNAVEPEMKYHY
jgi:hypothetical protein